MIIYVVCSLIISIIFLYLIFINANLISIYSFGLFIESLILISSIILLLIGKSLDKILILNKKIVIFIILSIVVVQIHIFLIKIGMPPVWSDEFVTFMINKSHDIPFPKTPSGYYSTSNIVYYYATFYLNSFLDFRLFSYISYLLIGIIIYLICKNKTNTNIALLSLFVFFLTPNFFELAFYARSYIFSALILFLFIFGYLYFNLKNKINHLYLIILLLLTLGLHLQNLAVFIFILLMIFYDNKNWKIHIIYFFLASLFYIIYSIFILKYHYLNYIDRSIINNFMQIKETGIFQIDNLQRLFNNYLPINFIPEYYSNFHRFFSLNPIIALGSFSSIFLFGKFKEKFIKIIILFFILHLIFLIFGKMDIYMNRGYLIIMILGTILTGISLNYFYINYRKIFYINFISLFIITILSVIITYGSYPNIGNKIYAHFNIRDGINYIPDNITQYKYFNEKYSEYKNKGYLIISTDIPENLYFYNIKPDYYLSSVPIESFNTNGHYKHYYDNTPFIIDYDSFIKTINNKKIILLTSFSLDGCSIGKSGKKIYPELFHIDCRIIEYLNKNNHKIIFQSKYSKTSKIYIFN